MLVVVVSRCSHGSIEDLAPEVAGGHRDVPQGADPATLDVIEGGDAGSVCGAGCAAESSTGGRLACRMHPVAPRR